MFVNRGPLGDLKLGRKLAQSCQLIKHLFSLRERKSARGDRLHANKIARIIWAVLIRNERYRPHSE